MRRANLLLSLALGALGLLSLPAAAHDVKDPVCRMTVDSDTTPWKHRLGNKSFYFCSKLCREKFAAEPERYEKLAAQLERGDLHEYEVLLATNPARPVAGQPVQLAFTVRYKKSGELVRNFELVHERLFHLVMVTKDLRWFEHQHPVRGPDGIFRKTWTFPAPGEYRLYADFTPADGDNQVIPLSLTVGGGPAKHVPLTPDTRRAKQVGEYRIELQVRNEPLVMERPAVFTYTIRDRRGRPVRDMQPFIGAMGHLLAISEDGEQVVHTHAVSPTRSDSMEAEAVRITPAMATATGPAFSFKLTPPTSGLYRVWAQFMHRNRVLTVPFTFHVQDLWTQAPRTAAAGRTPAPAALRCPVMKNPIADRSRAPSLRVNGAPVYLCCASCVEPLMQEPAKYLAAPVKDPVTGESFRVTPATPKLQRDGALYLFRRPETQRVFKQRQRRSAPAGTSAPPRR